jgi:hypothetical protein
MWGGLAANELFPGVPANGLLLGVAANGLLPGDAAKWLLPRVAENGLLPGVAGDRFVGETCTLCRKVITSGPFSCSVFFIIYLNAENKNDVCLF